MPIVNLKCFYMYPSLSFVIVFSFVHIFDKEWNYKQADEGNYKGNRKNSYPPLKREESKS